MALVEQIYIYTCIKFSVGIRNILDMVLTVGLALHLGPDMTNPALRLIISLFRIRRGNNLSSALTHVYVWHYLTQSAPGIRAHGVSCHVRSRASSGNDLIGV